MRRNDRSSDGRQKRTRGQRPRTISVSLSDRGQTTQDFAIGIGVFLLSVAFVFSYLPSLTTPFDSSVGGAEAAQADRIADRIVYETSSSDRPNEIEKDEFENSYATDPEDFAEEVGLRSSDENDIVFDRVNIRIEEFDGDVVDNLDGGHEYDGQSAASSARIVTLDNDECDPACRLVVRVW